MSAVVKPRPNTKTPHFGPLDWRRLVEWLQFDGVITDEEAQRTIARCAQAESAQHPLVRLASVAMRRAAGFSTPSMARRPSCVACRCGAPLWPVARVIPCSPVPPAIRP